MSAPERVRGRGEVKSGLQYTLTGNTANPRQWPYLPPGRCAQAWPMYLVGATVRLLAYADSLCA